ncbi:MAG TPA: hypothetical protein PLJ44_08435 [Victivallales bacterium]|nr:hypothetical protein [Victivallales bacterium]
MESVRTTNGPRQRVVASVGKLFGRDDEEKIGWLWIGEILSGIERAKMPNMFEPANAETPDLALVDLHSVRVERMRRFGDVFIALCVWRKYSTLLPNMAVMSTTNSRISHAFSSSKAYKRFSELKLAHAWYGKMRIERSMKDIHASEPE